MTIKEKLESLNKNTTIIARNILGHEEEITKVHALKNYSDILSGHTHESQETTIVLIMDI